MMHTVERAAGREIVLQPAPVAMVWNEPGVPHVELAVPGVLLAPGDALVEVDLATICGSDVHTWRGDRTAHSPLVLGHEQVGRVVAVGEGAVRADGTPLELGERVVWSVAASCGRCDRCERGLPQKCRELVKYGHEKVHRGWELSGGFASHVQLRAGTAVVPIGEELPNLVAAPLSCAGATAMAAVEAAEERTGLEGTTVLVVGAGMLGLSIIALAEDRGARVIALEPNPARRALAVRFGAAETADPFADPRSADSLDSAIERLRAYGCGRPWAAIEASGHPAAVETALRALAVGGVAVLVGSVSPGPAVRLDPELVVRRLLRIQGVHNYTPAQLRAAVEVAHRLWRSRPFDELVSATFRLGELDRALEAAASGEHVRVGVAPKRRSPGS